MLIRKYRPQDRADCFDVCIKTGRAGQDATGIYSDDDLIPEIFCGPYVDLEPDLAFVVDDGERVIGYAFGTADTRAFVERYRAAVLPGFVKRFGDLEGKSADEREMTELGLNPDRMIAPHLDEYPAHLHIDLLPQARGQGVGRRLIETLLDEFAARGATGVHLDMDPANADAGAFYARLGFHILNPGDDDTVRFAMRLPRMSVA